ncbi:MAG: phospholipase D-like domain-containing protein [Thermoplasmatales archaeon]
MIYEGTDLKWIIPYIYLTSDRGGVVYVISPWIDINIELSLTWKLDSSIMSFLEVIKSFSEREVKTIILLSETEKGNSLNLKSISQFEKHELEYHYIKNLHSKAVLGQRLMYIGSANITYSGLNRNQEAVTIERVYDQKENLKKLFGGLQLWQTQRVK